MDDGSSDAMAEIVRGFVERDDFSCYRLSNLSSYDFLLSLIRSELDSRKPDWQPIITNRNQPCDGFLGAPILGLAAISHQEFKTNA